MDRASYTHGGSSGGYAYINSGFPRRTADKARLSSREFKRTGKVMHLINFHTFQGPFVALIIHPFHPSRHRPSICHSRNYYYYTRGHVMKGNNGHVAIQSILEPRRWCTLQWDQYISHIQHLPLKILPSLFTPVLQ